ncbi:helix-turn-helix transcriptional regulator [Corynebacterium durum]|uniref:helix-turn-helix transcriptional regulator n=1 Tax=Corynebacterium durum TaxID=61592 RepID=UPI0028805995|nr:helix-turn-helix transcriptional regulator [Corynebacterium durum]
MSIKLALLSLLADHPRGVGQLRHDFEDITKHTWPVNVGQVFQTIQRLERDGLIAHHSSEIGETGRSAEIYAITQAGRDVVHDWLTTASMRPRDDRDELVIKIAIAAQLAVSNTMVNLPELIQTQRRVTMKELREITQLKAQTPAEQSAERLLYERRIFDLEAEARWLDHVETLATPRKHDDNSI